MSIIKPPVLPAWADGGDKVQPTNLEISSGWPSSSIPPSRQRFNWVLNYVANAVRYFSRRGVVDYDALETYQTDDVVRGDNGLLYRSLADGNTANTPSTTPGKWGSVRTVTPSLSDKSTNIATTKFASDYTDAAVAAAIGAIPTMSVTPSVVGTMRNGSMTVSAASASATFTADEIIVQSSLGGTSYQLYGFNKTINLATSGVGGMDTGSAPVSGFVALYAIYNSTSSVSALMAVNCTSAAAPEVYGGSNMPVGYTASALVSVWRTNSISQLVIGTQCDRQILFPSSNIAFITSNSVSGSINASSVIPKNAKSVSGSMAIGTTGGYTYFGLGISNGQTALEWQGYAFQATEYFSDLAIITPQTLQYGIGNGSLSWNSAYNLFSYRF